MGIEREAFVGNPLRPEDADDGEESDNFSGDEFVMTVTFPFDLDTVSYENADEDFDDVIIEDDSLSHEEIDDDMRFHWNALNDISFTIDDDDDGFADIDDDFDEYNGECPPPDNSVYSCRGYVPTPMIPDVDKLNEDHNNGFSSSQSDTHG